MSAVNRHPIVHGLAAFGAVLVVLQVASAAITAVFKANRPRTKA
jgi:hypothetical protein